MADITSIADPGVCETHDHGVTPTRQTALQAEALAFNHVLAVTTDGHKGTSHNAAVAEANRDFDAFLPGHNGSNDGAFEASKAFYEQVTKLPIGERKELLALTQKENEAAHAHDKKVPLMIVDMDSSAYLNSLEFRQGNYAYHFAYIGGMCAEVPDFNPSNPAPGQNRWDFTLPTLNIHH